MHPLEALQWLERAVVYGLIRIRDRAKAREALKVLTPVVGAWVEQQKQKGEKNESAKGSKELRKRTGR